LFAQSGAARRSAVVDTSGFELAAQQMYALVREDADEQVRLAAAVELVADWAKA